MNHTIRKGLAVTGVALIGAAFGYSEQNGARNDARARANTIEHCTQGVAHNAVVTHALEQCVESQASGGPVDSSNVYVGEPVAELEAYGVSQQNKADSVDTGEVVKYAAIGAVAAVVLG